MVEWGKRKTLVCQACGKKTPASDFITCTTCYNKIGKLAMKQKQEIERLKKRLKKYEKVDRQLKEM